MTDQESPSTTGTAGARGGGSGGTIAGTLERLAATLALRREVRVLRRALPRPSRHLLGRIDRRLGLLGVPTRVRMTTLRDTAEMLAEGAARGQEPGEVVGNWEELCDSIARDLPRRAPGARVASALATWALLAGVAELALVALAVALSLPWVFGGLPYGIAPLVWLDARGVMLGVNLALVTLPIAVAHELGRLGSRPAALAGCLALAVPLLAGLQVLGGFFLRGGYALNGYQPWKVLCVLALPFVASLALRRLEEHLDAATGDSPRA